MLKLKIKSLGIITLLFVERSGLVAAVPSLSQVADFVMAEAVHSGAFLCAEQLTLGQAKRIDSDVAQEKLKFAHDEWNQVIDFYKRLLEAIPVSRELNDIVSDYPEQSILRAPEYKVGSHFLYEAGGAHAQWLLNELMQLRKKGHEVLNKGGVLSLISLESVYYILVHEEKKLSWQLERYPEAAYRGYFISFIFVANRFLWGKLLKKDWLSILERNGYRAVDSSAELWQEEKPTLHQPEKVRKRRLETAEWLMKPNAKPKGL